MYVCHCNVVTDHEIRAVISRGAEDLCAIAERCGAGSGCGGCVATICALLAESGVVCEQMTATAIRAELARRGLRPGRRSREPAVV